MRLFLSVLVLLVLSVGLLLLSMGVSFQASEGREKGSPYECGFECVNSARTSFSIRFFLLGVLFVVFDVEIVLLVPALFLVYGGLSSWGVSCFLLFMIALVLGCLYERREGSMDWVSDLKS
uniref:NADH-ubiquinone oxidoreductase chain 3 n=1 Tax=Modiolus modiolus TaxID=40256 RepID=A0A1L7H867_MODMO|nr:NADH dehydrogenase subunit 3 [Modiolus modiolus]